MRGRTARELALRALYQVDVGKCEPARAVATVVAMASADGDEPPPDAGAVAQAESLFHGTAQHLPELDGWIGGLARGWDVGRMAAIDRNLLRLAAYELVYRPGVPAAVVINEAVELAKIYSTAESGKFVNGILSALAARLPGRLPPRPRPEEESHHASPSH